MELGKIDVVLNQSTCTYFPGSLVQGYLQIELPTPKKIKAIYIKFNGDGAVRFENIMVISNTGKTQNIISYADEKYLQHKHTCLKDSGSSGTLAAGRHIYPFTYKLPFNLPSSFHHEYGTIRYFLKTVIEYDRGFKQRTFKDFFIKCYLNLHLHPQLQENCYVSLIKKSKFLWVENVKIKINVKVSKSGFTIGEKMLIFTEVKNMSDEDISDIKFNIIQTAQFFAHSPKKDSKTSHATLASSNLGLQRANTSKNYHHEFTVPDFPYESLVGSKIINVKYYLEVIAVRGRHQSLTGKTQISIGIW